MTLTIYTFNYKYVIETASFYFKAAESELRCIDAKFISQEQTYEGPMPSYDNDEKDIILTNVASFSHYHLLKHPSEA